MEFLIPLRSLVVAVPREYFRRICWWPTYTFSVSILRKKVRQCLDPTTTRAKPAGRSVSGMLCSRLACIDTTHMPRKDSCDSAALYIQALDQGCTYLGTLPTVEVELGLSYPPRSYLHTRARMGAVIIRRLQHILHSLPEGFRYVEYVWTYEECARR